MARILKHASACKFLQESDHNLWQDAINESRNSSLGAQLEMDSDDENNDPSQKKLKGQGTLDLSKLHILGKKEKDK